MQALNQTFPNCFLAPSDSRLSEWLGFLSNQYYPINNLKAKSEQLEDESTLILRKFDEDYTQVLNKFKHLSRRVNIGKHANDHFRWTNTIESTEWLPIVGPNMASLGQTKLRQKPFFYLFTRFISLCR